MIDLFINNLAIIKLISNFINYFKNKSIYIQYYKIWQIIKNIIFETIYILIKNIVIYKLTKLLNFEKFDKIFRLLILLLSIKKL